MKNLILAATIFLSMNAFATENNPTVNSKVLNTFNKVFKDAQNVQWSTTARYAEASFTTKGAIKTRAFIDTNGNLLQTIRYYKEESLPAQLLYNLKSEYNNHIIWGVVEVSNRKGTLYNITLKDDKYWYHVKMAPNSNMQLDKRYKRGEL